MKLAISNIAWAPEQDEVVYDRMQELGFTGLEIAPTRIFPKHPYEHIKEAAVWLERLQQKYGFDVPSIQSIWYGRTERIFGSAAERTVLRNYTHQAIDFAAALGCQNLVFGCPKNRCITETFEPDTATNFFREIAEYALARKTVIGFEANPAIYQTNYINTTRQALELIEKVASDGFYLNLDIGTMLCNEESVSDLAGKVRYINHIHISEPMLAPLKRRELHLELAEVLRSENYGGYISIEMSRTTDLDIVLEAMTYIANVFK